MRLRYLLLAGTLGLLGALHFSDVALSYITIIGCSIIYSLRRIDYQIGDLKGHIVSDRSSRSSARDLLIAHACGIAKADEDLILDARKIFAGDAYIVTTFGTKERPIMNARLQPARKLTGATRQKRSSSGWRRPIRTR
jgi:hypothetical protein